MPIVELRRNSSPPHLTSSVAQSLPRTFPATTTSQPSEASSPNANTSVQSMMTVKTAPTSPNAAVWRKISHPPLSRNNDRRQLDLQLQLKNIGTKDDWATITCGFMTENDPYSRTRFAGDECIDGSASSSTSSSTPSAASTMRTVSPSIYQRLLLQSDDLSTLIRSIMDEAKTLLDAETCSLFLVDNEKNELVARVFDHGGDGVEELRVPLEHGVVGRVATTRTMMNVRDAHRCPFFYSHVDELTGFRTHNILCFPIVDNAGTFVGVAELCNKRGARAGFSRHDERCAKAFAVYCATSISHCLLYKKVQEAHRRSHMAAEMVVQGSKFLVAEEGVNKLEAEPVRHWRFWHPNFNDFSFSPRSIGETCFHRAAMTMFDDLGFNQRFRVNKRKLAHFILRVANGYRDVPYHNWSHAFAVAHFCWLVLRTRAARTHLDELERFSLLIACLCHDIDHRGTTNNFQIQSNTPLAQLYSSEGSVLERHHYAQTVTILQMSDCNVLEQLTTLQYKSVLSQIRDVILATDIAAHLNKASRIRQMVNDVEATKRGVGEGFDLMSSDHHYLFSCLVMTASDLSDQSKNFHNSKSIAENIYSEFFAQGDLELQLGHQPAEMMDRRRAYVPQIQVEFMDNIGVPVFDMLSRLVPEGVPTYEAIRANRKCWLAMHEELLSTGRNGRGNTDYLRDEELERRVIERVSRDDPVAAAIAAGVQRQPSQANSPKPSRSLPPPRPQLPSALSPRSARTSPRANSNQPVLPTSSNSLNNPMVIRR
ncbi:unnamed protein product [Caenorhabditis auriculariae]|uniref:Phosphodiesterase n=1 Tax=Caenorhabditis auriculariae TaxID=2777116 RepID=A0A8S1GXP3_9PELO|nr:unnamed protein product [Caenorhabditis auriculariae]